MRQIAEKGETEGENKNTENWQTADITFFSDFKHS